MARTQRNIENLVHPEILANGGYTDKEMECLPFFVKYRFSTGQLTHRRFADADHAARCLGHAESLEREGITHNVPVTA